MSYFLHSNFSYFMKLFVRSFFSWSTIKMEGSRHLFLLFEIKELIANRFSNELCFGSIVVFLHGFFYMSEERRFKL